MIYKISFVTLLLLGTVISFRFMDKNTFKYLSRFFMIMLIMSIWDVIIFDWLLNSKYMLLFHDKYSAQNFGYLMVIDSIISRMITGIAVFNMYKFIKAYQVSKSEGITQNIDLDEEW